MSRDVVERLRELEVRLWAPATGGNTRPLRSEAAQAIGDLLAVVEAAKELDDNWDAVNRTFTLGHPYSQKLRAALVRLYAGSSASVETIPYEPRSPKLDPESQYFSLSGESD